MTSPADPTEAEQGEGERRRYFTDPHGPRLAVVGIGYAGLPLAVLAAEHGYRVLGVDIDQTLVHCVNQGISPVDTVSSAVLAGVHDNLFATVEPQGLAAASVVALCVPTPLDTAGRPDFQPLHDATEVVAAHLRAGQLVIVESTSHPGTTDSLVKPILEQSGLRAGRDFSLAFAPERVDPGNAQYRLTNTPKVVGGLTPLCSARARAFYGRFIEDVHVTTGLREAEASKILENTYRQVNMALINEFSRLCHSLGVDVWDTIEAAGTKPFGFEAFHPAVGVGGHCIPVDPMYLVHEARRLGLSFRMGEVAQQVNDEMPRWTAERILTRLSAEGQPSHDGCPRVLLLGMTYKPDVADTRNSPAFPLAAELAARDVNLDFHDPYVETITVGHRTLRRLTPLHERIGEADLVVLVQRHKDYGDDLLSRARRVFSPSGPLHLPNAVQ